METDKHYIMVGVFVLLACAGILLFTLWLTQPHDKKDYRQYYILFSESVSGLSEGNAVKFRGVDVGKVDTIKIDPEDTSKVRVIIRVLKSTPVKTDTLASLKLQGITGVVFVELSGGSPNEADLIPLREDQVLEIPAEQSSINAIVDVLPQILDKISTIAEQAKNVLTEENVASISTTIKEWEKISSALRGQTENIEEIVENSKAISRDVRQISADSKKEINELTRNLNETSERLNKLILKTEKASGTSFQEFNRVLLDIKKTSRKIGHLTDEISDDPSMLIHPLEKNGVPAR